MSGQWQETENTRHSLNSNCANFISILEYGILKEYLNKKVCLLCQEENLVPYAFIIRYFSNEKFVKQRITYAPANPKGFLANEKSFVQLKRLLFVQMYHVIYTEM
jgi:hypothetical protein